MFDEYMLNFGFSDEEIDLIKSSYPLNTYRESSLLYNTKNLVNYLHRNTFDNESIIKFVLVIPQVISMSIEDIKVRVSDLSLYGFNKIDIFNMIKQYPYIINITDQRINNKYQTFTELGFNKEDINTILLNKTNILNIDPGLIKRRYEFLIDYGYRKKHIISIFKELPDIIDMSVNKLNNKFEDLINIGFKKQEIIKITSYFPKLLILNNEELTSRMTSLLGYGYSIGSIINIIRKVPIILKSNYLDAVTTKIDNLIRIGFTQEEVIKITEENPYILLFSVEYINNNFEEIVKCNLYSTEVVSMVTGCPILLTYNSHDLVCKISIYNDLGLLDIVKDDSKLLLISTQLIDARLKIVGKNTTDLFLDEIEFKNKYKLTREDYIKE